LRHGRARGTGPGVPVDTGANHFRRCAWCEVGNAAFLPVVLHAASIASQKQS
jgi:hypothetical protein